MGQNLRVAILSWESLYTIQVGGLGVVATRLAEEMAKHGDEVYFFTRAAEGQPRYLYINGVHYHTCKFYPGTNPLEFAYNMSQAMVESLYKVKRYEGDFDIVHGHDWLVVDALHALKEKGYPIFLTYHSTEYGRLGGRFGDSWESREIGGKEWYGGYIADRITTVSNTMKHELCRLYQIPPDKIDVIPNAVDPSRYRMEVDPGRIKARHGIHPLAPMVYFVGRMEYQKGPDLLLEAIPDVLREHWGVKFVFAGGGGMTEQLGRRANELGISHAVRLLGFLPYWEFLELLNACDIVCLPSRNEPFGIALLEAWAAGKPVVATDVGGYAENIENFADGVKVYPWPESVAWGIKYLLDSPDAMRKVTEGGKEKVKQFSWSNVLSKLMETYRAAKKKLTKRTSQA